MPETPKVQSETRMLIDGKLVGGESGTFSVVNPATEDVLGEVADANDSAYGLAGNVMSGSLEHSLAIARRLRAGVIGVNGGAPFGVDVPFGGYKASGVGRQNGDAGFDQYLEVKAVGWPAG